ncbi:MAG: TIGR03960 family B12-binding radical SAM protein [Proteobacteria bacterium]|nr:TIGR03960 family B12-binding radical SAM protein [Pseudomonadota bacterium]MBU1687282.1 TIGR03960 family B12-binding radical SAM protein [Pseudomonadota bacterium]
MIPDEIFAEVSRPGRYCGNEFNVVHKDWNDAALRVVLVFPDLYEVGMSHQGLQILYHIINGRSDLLAERAYAPAPDLEKLLRERELPLFSLESRHPLNQFDILGITLPYELCYTNILTVLASAGIPLYSRDRGEGLPLVIGGGPCAFHPEPVADFFDAILLGDGEEAILEIVDVMIEARDGGLPRGELLGRLSQIAGVYVPGLYEPEYDGDGRFVGMQGAACNQTVRKRTLPDIELTGIDHPLVPLTRIVHDRLGIEIARGCTRGCRFCQAGMIYRPVRERSVERIMELAETGINNSGFDELALLSLSTGDYSCISQVLVKLMNRLARRRVSVSMPSMRVGTLTPDMMEQIRRVRKTGFTLAPEAGTDRLRQVINKGITEEDLLSASRSAFELGWKLLKFYFMFGLPTETPEDLAAIPVLVRKAYATGGTGGRKINVSVATFVPKPHTPFQRVPQLTIDEGFARIDQLKKEFRHKSFQLKWHDPRQSFLEGVMSRGDRRLAIVIESAWRAGARLDAWTDYFRLDTWQQAAQECGVDLDSYLRGRDETEPLPWDHLDCGVDPEFFREEYRKALGLVYTPDCRVHGCQKCGLCDFKTIRPVVHKADDVVGDAPMSALNGEGSEPDTRNHFHYRIQYNRFGPGRFLGHLELIQMFYRILGKIGLPLQYSQGFNPGPKVTFSPALPVGTESLAEYLLVDMWKLLADPVGVRDRLNAEMPGGFEVQSVVLWPGKIEQQQLTGYRVSVGRKVDGKLLAGFMAGPGGEVAVVRKGRQKMINAQAMIKRLALAGDGTIELEIYTESSKPGLKPMEILGHIMDLTAEERVRARVVKEWVREGVAPASPKVSAVV